jgi:hypothetical protein
MSNGLDCNWELTGKVDLTTSPFTLRGMNNNGGEFFMVATSIVCAVPPTTTQATDTT